MVAKGKRGRGSQQSDVRITSFSLPAEVYGVLHEASHEARLTKSAFVRAAIIEKAERVLAPATEPPA